MNVAMIECPYCRVQQPARIAAVPVADLRAARTHAQTCRSRRTR